MSIREAYAEGDSVAVIASREGYSSSTIAGIITGKTFSGLPGAVPLRKRESPKRPALQVIDLDQKERLIKAMQAIEALYDSLYEKESKPLSPQEYLPMWERIYDATKAMKEHRDFEGLRTFSLDVSVI
ncbi:hypothetical protein [Streptomyces sp. NPDC003273]|uniref:hypothetical protein n=1 Tax=Streptomyces sp. NPDC003273 TaxID=3364678 RepID=UPI0036906DE7